MTTPLSQRIASYTIDAKLDTDLKSIEASQQLVWINPSPDTISELRFYMYINAFKNTESTFLKDADEMFGQNIHNRKAEEWGAIDVHSMTVNDTIVISDTGNYIQPDDDNSADETVLSIALSTPILPFDTAVIDLTFTAKLPLLLVRTGYSRDDFYHVVHWFPQIGVYEKSDDGLWGWNCHQFHRHTEFYSNFGNYDVTIEAPDHLTIDGSGCIVSKELSGPGTQTIRFKVEDVIDFAWVAYPFFESFYDEWNGIEIRLHTAEEHANLAPRFIEAVKAALDYLEKNVGPYPYPSITMMDPPIHALSSGFMEYPTYITIGSFRYFPKGVRTIESLVIHEFGHQYFMGMVATNEKEEPWLDEGFVTYFEDRIMEATYGRDGCMIDLYGYQIGNSAFTRAEYVDLPDPSIGPVARPGWEFQTSYKGLVYSKTATVLKTMEGLVGIDVMNEIVQSYFNRWKFDHPNGHDFKAVVHDVVVSKHGIFSREFVDRFFDQLIYGSGVCDYAVTDIDNEKVWTKAGLFENTGSRVFVNGESDDSWRGSIVLRRLGEVILPVDVEVEFEDGEKKTFVWSGVESYRDFHFEKKVIACHLDPERKLYIDINLINNSKRLNNSSWIGKKVGVKTVYWIQNLLQSFAFLI